MDNNTVELHPHNPNWAIIFNQEAAQLKPIFAENLVSIHHIGSTAIPGIVAKPIIDILVIVKDMNKIEELNKQLEKIGYTARGELVVEGSKYFHKGNSKRTHHIHVFEEKHPAANHYIRFRDYLSAHPKEAKRYEALKIHLAEKHGSEREKYRAGKKDFIVELHKSAEAWFNHLQKLGPNPETHYPMCHVGNVKNKVVFLKNFIKSPNIIVGDYTYYHHKDGGERFEKENVLYHEPIIGDKLVIGKFTQIAMDAKFIMNASTHQMDGISTYPFMPFGGAFANYTPNFPLKGDTIIGNDVWIGYDACIMPGLSIGDGAIIGTRALVTKDVEPYTIIGGNPGKVIRKRFDDQTIAKLLEIKWWDWPIERIVSNLDAITGSNIDKLSKIV
jgi:virginiamycin A acetyltransferase